MDLLASHHRQQGGGGGGDGWGGGGGDGGGDGGGVDDLETGSEVAVSACNIQRGMIGTPVPHLSSPLRTVCTSVPTQHISTHLSLPTAVPVLAKVVPDGVDAGVTAVVALHQGQPLRQVGEEVGEPDISYSFGRLVHTTPEESYYLYS